MILHYPDGVERARIFRRLPPGEKLREFLSKGHSLSPLNATPSNASLFSAVFAAHRQLLFAISLQLNDQHGSLLATGNTHDTEMFHFLIIWTLLFTREQSSAILRISSRVSRSFRVIPTIRPPLSR